MSSRELRDLQESLRPDERVGTSSVPGATTRRAAATTPAATDATTTAATAAADDTDDESQSPAESQPASPDLEADMHIALTAGPDTPAHQRQHAEQVLQQRLDYLRAIRRQTDDARPHVTHPTTPHPLRPAPPVFADTEPAPTAPADPLAPPTHNQGRSSGERFKVKTEPLTKTDNRKAWLDNFDFIMTLTEWSDHQKCSRLVLDVSKVEKAWSEVKRAQLKASPPQCTYAELVAELQQRWIGSEPMRVHRRAFSRLRKGPNESILTFIDNAEVLGRRANVSDDEIWNHVCNELEDDVHDAFEIFGINNMSDLRQKGDKVDRYFDHKRRTTTTAMATIASEQPSSSDDDSNSTDRTVASVETKTPRVAARSRQKKKPPPRRQDRPRDSDRSAEPIRKRHPCAICKATDHAPYKCPHLEQAREAIASKPDVEKAKPSKN